MSVSRVLKKLGLVVVVLLFASEYSLPEDQDALIKLSQSLQHVMAKVSPTIVTLDVAAYVPPDDGEIAQGQSQSERQLLSKAHSIGSGVIVESDGFIITNAHVVEGATLIRATLDETLRPEHPRRNADQPMTTTYDARIVGLFEEADLALLKIEASGLPEIAFANSDNVKQGQLVFAVGSPEGYKNSASIGMISAVGRHSPGIEGATYLQTDAAINPGSSGGALVDTDANLVGITSFIVTNRGANVGLGFAVPSNLVQRIFKELKTSGHVSYGQIGIRVQNINPALARGLHISQEWGVVVSDVVPGGPAEKAGVQIKDVVLLADGQRMANESQFTMSLYDKRVGSNFELQLERSASSYTVKVPVVERAANPEKIRNPEGIDAGLVSKLGVVCAPLGQHRDGLRSTSGIIVVAKLVQSDADVDLLAGDVIRSLNEIPIHSVADLRSELDRLRFGASAVLQIERQRRLQYLALEID